jgi:afadin
VNYSTSDAPKTALYPTQQQQQQGAKNSGNANPPSNPWEREEREKELEVRREQVRQWRDQQIVELSLLPQRTPQQEEQLKTLVLERDFERRAQEEENEEENDIQYQKNNSAMQEVLRLQPNPTLGNNVTSQITVPTTRLKQVDIKTTPTNISPTSSDATTPPSSESMAGHPFGQQHPPPIQPKSILKSTHNYNSNPSSPSKHGKTTSFAPKIDTKSHNLSEITMNNTNANQMLSQLNKDMSDLAIEFQPDEQHVPPPPPERGSSFAVMHQQKLRNSGTFQKLQFNEHPIINNTAHMNNNNINNNNSKYTPSNEPMLSPTATTGTFTAHQIQQQMNLINNNLSFTRDNKRVSFHDHENNNNSVDLMGEHEHDLSTIREDPNVSDLTHFGNEFSDFNARNH